MVYEFTAEELQRLEKCRKEFNRLTGSRQSLQQFIQQEIQETIAATEQAARQSEAMRGRIMAGMRGVRCVH